MSADLPRVFNIAPGGNFLDVLAKQILDGQLFGEQDDLPELSRWTILLPTRRAARQLGSTLLKKCGKSALLLPRIRPLGDLEEDQADGSDTNLSLPPAISRTGQFFGLYALLSQWSKENPLIGLAEEISNSPTQSLALATSLLQLIDQVETEEVSLDHLKDIYDADLSEHRSAILSLLSIVKTALPKLLVDQNLLGRADRRNRLLRLQARSIANGEFKGPIIAAGSTGTIPATRELLKAVALHPQGAVYLPGLDQNMSEESWRSLKPDHPQYALRKLLEFVDITRDEIRLVSTPDSNRNFLSSELMRPTETTEQWPKILARQKDKIQSAIKNLHLIEAPDRHLEARSIALILRGALEVPKQTAALVTPDRDLARRVKSELLRWNINIDDSAGEPLTNRGLASLAQLLLALFSSGFSPASLVGFLNHPDCNLGFEHTERIQNLHNLELAVLRNYGVGKGLAQLNLAFERARLAAQNGERSHPIASRLSDENWHSMQTLLTKIMGILEPLTAKTITSFQIQLVLLMKCLNACAPQVDQFAFENQSFNDAIEEIGTSSHLMPPCDFATALAILVNILRSQTIKLGASSHPRLSIYGLLEARMMPADILILGGLNETKWPAQPDPGPWLNRPMRDILGLQQPEREIGVSAHDLAQGLSYNKVYLTCAKRIEGAPLVPSRWILRLKTVLQATGLNPDQASDDYWLTLAKAIDEPESLSAIAKPRPTPPIAARPNRISVTEVEKLIRDPYAVYARRILRLEPLPDFARLPDAALRGVLFHEAISNWNNERVHNPEANQLQLLLQAGAQSFAPFMLEPEIASFWWWQFQKMAVWLVELEGTDKSVIKTSKTELNGELDFEISDRKLSLYGRADRIDIQGNGYARIIDYKTGNPPTNQQVTIGLNPQLPLEAAILAYGKFEGLNNTTTDKLDYIQISGRTIAGEIKSVAPVDGSSIMELSDRHFLGLKSLLKSYQSPSQPYLPRVAPLKEEGELDYDHLSRFREWMLGGEKL